MASIYGANATKAFNTVPADKVDVTDWSGRVRVMYDSFVVTAAPTNGDKLYMGRLPKGAKVYGARFTCPDMGTAGVLNIGYEYVSSADGTSDIDAYFAAVDVNAAAVDSVMAGTAAGYALALEGDAYVVITISTAWTATSGTIKLMLEYAID